MLNGFQLSIKAPASSNSPPPFPSSVTGNQWANTRYHHQQFIFGVLLSQCCKMVFYRKNTFIQ